jgi:aryl-alcohol dehydrogenase-like predicted oxidoreductase
MTYKLTSRVGFGTASLHHVKGLSSKLNLLDTAYDTGIRYFDTAPLYGHGTAERTLGQFVKKHRSQSNVIIATKVGLIPNPFITSYPKLLLPYIALRKITTASLLIKPRYWQPKRDFTANYLVQRIEASLLSLGLDCLDIVLLHEPTLSELQTMDSLCETVLSLKQRGLVKHFGISAQIEAAQWFKANALDLAEVMQIEMPLQLNEAEKSWISKNATSTFGHFRLQPYVDSDMPSDARLNRVVKQAVAINPTGTILFSSTKSTHITSFVRAINEADAASKGV